MQNTRKCPEIFALRQDGERFEPLGAGGTCGRPAVVELEVPLEGGSMRRCVRCARFFSPRLLR